MKSWRETNRRNSTSSFYVTFLFKKKKTLLLFITFIIKHALLLFIIKFFKVAKNRIDFNFRFSVTLRGYHVTVLFFSLFGSHLDLYVRNSGIFAT